MPGSTATRIGTMAVAVMLGMSRGGLYAYHAIQAEQAAPGRRDALASGDDVVCDDRVLAAARKVRWVAVYSAGVEACLGKAALAKPGIVVTNMRAIAGPVMAEHSIALMYALSRSLHVSVGRQARGDGWSRNFTGSTPQSLSGKTVLVVGLGGYVYFWRGEKGYGRG